jgi:hypothetical protein
MQKDLEKKEWQITGYRGKKRRRRGRMVLLEVYMLYIYIFIGFFA